MLIMHLIVNTISTLLIVSIFKARSRIQLNNSNRERLRFKKDIKFAINSLLMNFLFIILNLPVDILDLLPSYDTDLHSLLAYIFNSSSTVNFYILILTNS